MSSLLYSWPYPGLAAGMLGVVALLLAPRPPTSRSRWHDPVWLVCLMLPVYMIHQFEEHGINLRGEHYHFIVDICSTLGFPTLSRCPATPEFIAAVNCGGGVWIPGLLAIAYRRRNLMVGACAMGIPLVNAVAHLAQAIVHRQYNSGVLTAVILFVPMCGWTLFQFRRAGLLDGRRLAAVVASGVLVHAVLIASLLARSAGHLGEVPLLAVNVLDGLLPLVLATVVPASSKVANIVSEAPAAGTDY